MLPSARKPEARLRPESNLKTRPEDMSLTEAARHEEDDKKKTNQASQVMSPEEGAECGQQRHDGRSRRFRSNPIALFRPTLLDLLLVLPWGSDRGAARLRRDGWYTFLCASSRLLAPTTHRVRLR